MKELMAKEQIVKQIESIDYVTFYLGELFCGINILDVQEINKHFKITKVPLSDDFLVGIMNLRGVIVSVIDLRKKMNLREINKEDSFEHVIIIKNQEDNPVGLLVDEISDVITVSPSKVMAPPPNISNVDDIFFKGVYQFEELLIIIDILKVVEIN